VKNGTDTNYCLTEGEMTCGKIKEVREKYGVRRGD
jgi:hypothetical protein